MSKSESIIRFSNGPILGKSAKFAGYILLLPLFTLQPLAIIFALPGALLIFSKDGFEFDCLSKKYRLSLQLFGFYHVGKWKDFAKIEGVFLTHQNVTEGAFSRSNRFTSSTEKLYVLYLRVKNPLEHIAITSFKQESDALNALSEITQKTGITIITSLPKTHEIWQRRK